MSQEQATSGEQAGRTVTEQPDTIARAVDALKRRTRQALSPWVQRRLERSSSRLSGAADLGARHPALLTWSHTFSLLNRLQRTVDRSTVWKPDVGPLGPAMVQRFARTVASRLQPLEWVGVRRREPAREAIWGEPVELTLPIGTAPPSPQLGDLTAGTQVRGPSVFTAGQRIPPMQPTPPAGPRTPRATTPPRAARQVQRKSLPPDARLFSRVEEVIPGRPAQPPEVPPGQPPPTRRVEPPPEQPQVEPIPHREAGPPAVQLKPEPGVPARQLAEESPEAEPPHRPAGETAEFFAGEPPARPRQEPEAPLPTRPAGRAPARPPERRPEARPGAEPPPVQRGAGVQTLADTAAAPIQRAEGIEGPIPTEPAAVAAGEPPAREPELRREIEPPVRAPPAEIEPEAGLPLRMPSRPVEQPEPPGGVTVAPPAAEPPSAQREVEPEVAPPRPDVRRPPQRSQPAPRRPVEQPPLQQAEAPGPAGAPEMPPSAVSRPDAGVEQPASGLQAIEPASVQRTEESGRLPQVRPPEQPDRRPALRRAAEAPPVRRQEELAGPRGMPTTEEPVSEAVPLQHIEEPPAPLPSEGDVVAPGVSERTGPLAQDILARAASRAQPILRRFVAPPDRGVTGVWARLGPVSGAAPRPVVADRTAGRSRRQVRRRATSPAIYSRTPEKRVGPDLSLTVLKLRPGRGVQRQPAGVSPGLPLPPASQDPFQAIWGGEPLAQPPPRRPAAPGARPSVAQARPAEEVQPILRQLMEPPLPLARPRVMQPTPAQVVQREVTPPEITPIGEMPSVQGQLVQRVEGEGGEPEEIDLADLARKIYPLVKRMLSIERERRSPW